MDHSISFDPGWRGFLLFPLGELLRVFVSTVFISGYLTYAVPYEFKLILCGEFCGVKVEVIFDPMLSILH